MPISSSNSVVTLQSKQYLNITGKSTRSNDQGENKDLNLSSQNFPSIPPVIQVSKFANKSYNSSSCGTSTLTTEDVESNRDSSHQASDGRSLVAARSAAERNRNPDRMSLDRRGLTIFPNVTEESRLRLMSLQHNLISKIEPSNLTPLTKLVFLDLYDNQIERLCSFDPLINLRVLLLGKNRLKKVEGLTKLAKLEVLDIHGNQISQVAGLDELGLLKVLNLAGNNIKTIGCNDFQGLIALRELNLRRNKIKKLLGFGDAPQLQKLFLSNNEIQRIEDVGCLIKLHSLKEIAIDGNPLSVNPDCIYFLVSYLPNLQFISTVEINEQVRKAAISWRTCKEQSNSAFLDLSTQVCVNVRREQVISNARSNWEHQTNRTKKPSPKLSTPKSEQKNPVHCQNFKKLEPVKLRGQKNFKGFGSLTSINTQLDKKTNLKMKSSSIENLSTIDDNHSNAAEFKLPPILVPIINNINSTVLKNVKLLKSQELIEGIESTDSDFDCSDLDGRRRRVEIINGEELFEASRRCNATPTRVNCNPQLLKMDSSSSKTSSIDSGKSVLSDSSGSSLTVDKFSRRDNRVKSAQPTKLSRYRSNRAATARVKQVNVSPSPPPIVIPPKEREQGGDYLVEITGRCLNIYGQGSLKFIDRPWDATRALDVNTVKFNYSQFNGIATILNKLKNRFPNAQHFVFKETNISHLGQLNALAEVQGLTSLQIDPEGNPIIFKNWMVYAVFRLAHWGLRYINGVELTNEDIEFANKEYAGLVDIVLCSLPETLLQPLLQRLHLDKIRKQNAQQLTAKQFLFNNDPVLKNVVAKEALQWRRGQVTQDDLIWRHKGKLHLSNLIDQTVSAIEKLQLLEKKWSNILYEIIHRTLQDYAEMELYMKRCSEDLEKEI